MRYDQPKSLLEIAVKAVGTRRAVIALSFAVKWGLWTESDDPDARTGRTPDFARWALMGRSTADKQMRTFRDAFPMFVTPDAMWAWARPQVDRNEFERVQLAQLGALRWDVVA